MLTNGSADSSVTCFPAVLPQAPPRLFCPNGPGGRCFPVLMKNQFPEGTLLRTSRSPVVRCQPCPRRPTGLGTNLFPTPTLTHAPESFLNYFPVRMVENDTPFFFLDQVCQPTSGIASRSYHLHFILLMSFFPASGRPCSPPRWPLWTCWYERCALTT